ncbi:MAG: acyltransferase [Phycisphaeraceae bacterium]|nr:acyltransferase [Phycisphaeraceae bacterium]
MAILLVMLHHQTLIWLSPDKADRVFAWCVDFGWSGVDLFFVLSGFLITGILLDAKGDPHRARNFYARRTLRIFPLYYAVIVASLVLLPWIASMSGSEVIREKLDRFGRIEGSEIWYWLYLSNFPIAWHGDFQHGILGISWSLAIEEQFYLVWPLLVWTLSARALGRVCIALIIAAFLVRLGMVLGGAHFIAVYVLTPARMDVLAIGALLALAARGEGGLSRFRRPAAWIAPVALVVIVAIAIIDEVTGLNVGTGMEFPTPQSGRLMGVIGFGLTGVLYGACLVRGVTSPAGSALARLLTSRFLVIFGKYSYALYFFHVPVRAVVRDLVYGPPDKSALITFPTVMGSLIPAQLIFYVVATIPTLILAWLSWHLYEKHFLKLKRFFEAKRSRSGERDAAPAS